MAIKILIGGSPCTYWSIAQTNNRETKAEGMGWELFKNYLIAKEKFKPDLFLYENNESAAQAIKDQIAKELGVELMYINSALVSAQNRERFYAFNWEAEPPSDRGIYVVDVLEDIECEPIARFKECIRKNVVSEYEKIIECKDKAIYHLKCDSGWQDNKIGLLKTPTLRAGNPFTLVRDKQNRIRTITATEAARLQTMPDDYCKAVSDSQAYKALGNGWTAEVIIHLLNHALKDVPRDEEIVVLSMYDGIATGRYCLDKMGFTNVKYHAYEIDKYPIQVAMDNYPDIIQHGDAFAVREDAWKAPQTRSEWLDELLGV